MAQKVRMLSPEQHLAFILEMSYLKDGPSVQRGRLSGIQSQNLFKFLDIRDYLQARQWDRRVWPGNA